MNLFSWIWVGWIAVGLGIEAVALFRKDPDDTLSEHFWRWFGITPHGKPKIKVTGWVRARRFALLAGMAWLTVHFLTGGEF